MVTGDSFQREVLSAIRERLGADALDRYSVGQLVERLGITASRETVRKILRAGHTPRKRLQEQLLKEIQAAPTEAASLGAPRPLADAFGGNVTRDEVLDLLGQDASFVQVTAAPGDYPSALVINQLGGQRILVRCLDDHTQHGLASEEYFAPVVREMSAALRSLEIDRGLLITHTTPSPGAARTAEARQVMIQPYANFIQRIIHLPDVERAYFERLKRRGLSDGFQSLPTLRLSSTGDSQCDDSFANLLEFLEEDGDLAVATILGSYGTGKTSLALKAAHRLAVRSAEAQEQWVLPLWLSARTSDPSTVDHDLSAALRELAPTSHLGPKTLRRLTCSGRIWLFVDGLDESPGLRSQGQLKRFLDALLNYCHPHGRLILTARQELFDNRETELAFFERGFLEAGAKRTMLLRTQVMDEHHVEQIVRGTLELSDASRLLAEIRESEALRDLASRPIFLHILANARSFLRRSSPRSALSLFESYTTQWVEEEQAKTVRLDMPAEQRLEICELMALYAIRFGETGEGISVHDIEKIAVEHGSVRNLDAFVMEARVAMFLQRHPTADRFHFSHASLRSFFVARYIGRRILEGNFRDLERFPFSRADPLLRHFTIEKIKEGGRDPVVLLGDKLHQLLDWEHESPDSQEQPGFSIGPCFSYLVPNLAALLLDLFGEPASGAPLDLRGAHLAMVDLDAVLGKPGASLLLNRANLEDTTLSDATWKHARSQGAISPNGGHTTDGIRSYCEDNGLFAPPRFSGDGRDDFVLVPGGEYQVTSHSAADEPPSPDSGNVRLRSFLIQRYPVTNRQFLAFLDAFPKWAPRPVRKDTNNDYYLLGWPETDDDPRLKSGDWLDRPVVHVNWNAARAFAAASGLRLPTEVEWEVASRLTQDGSLARRPWGDDLSREWAVYWDGTSEPPLLPADSVYFKPARFSEWVDEHRIHVPHHMVGLVREWVADCWDTSYPCMERSAEQFSYYNSGFKLDPQNRWMPSDALQELRVLRGGSFQMPESDCTCHYRAPHRPGNVNPDAGFRCVRPVRVPRGLILGKDQGAS